MTLSSIAAGITQTIAPYAPMAAGATLLIALVTIGYVVAKAVSSYGVLIAEEASSKSPCPQTGRLDQLAYKIAHYFLPKTEANA